jgi:hypothetical protein
LVILDKVLLVNIGNSNRVVSFTVLQSISFQYITIRFSAFFKVPTTPVFSISVVTVNPNTEFS